MNVDGTSLSGYGDAVVSDVDESVCGVNSVLAAGVLDLCCVDTVVSVCGVNQVMSAGVLDLCGVDTVVSACCLRACVWCQLGDDSW